MITFGNTDCQLSSLCGNAAQFILEYVYILTFYVYLQLFSNVKKDLIKKTMGKGHGYLHPLCTPEVTT